MSMDTFRAAVDVSADYDSPITIGGGEPTLHPDLLAFVGIASMVSDEPIFMVTNGTCHERLWRVLVRARDRGKIDLRVSNDLWHDTSMIRPWVWKTAESGKMWWGDPSLGRRHLVRRGRARRNWGKLLWECAQSGIEVLEDKDSCTPRVSPDGRVWADVPGGGAMGTVDDPVAVSKAFDAIREHEERQ